MSKQDVRKEQIALIRFEKQLAEMARTLRDGAHVATSTDAKLGTHEASVAYEEMKTALVNLADATQRAHENLTTRAVASQGRFIDFNVPKGNRRQEVASILSRS
ncbi:MAG: hypothetical protein AAFW83_00115 [Pseudomonadota bacterium]